VLGDHKTVILGAGSFQEMPPILDRLPAEHSPLICRERSIFGDQVIPCSLTMAVMKAGPLLGQGVYFVDGSRSSVIEFDRNLLLPTRIC